MNLKQLTPTEKTLLVYGAVHLAMQTLQEHCGGSKFQAASEENLNTFGASLNRVLDLIEESKEGSY